MDRTADRIERFLADHPDGDLLVCVGFASAWGVAWLARRCRDRRVRLLMGDTRQRFGWEQVAQADRDDCLEFLRSDNVEVRNWYGHRECAEQAADAAQEWAEEAELWLAAECMNDLFTQSSHLESEWRPGWEFGCEAHVPDGVPCAYLNPTGPRHLEPGYLGTAGECRANTAILSRPAG